MDTAYFKIPWCSPGMTEEDFEETCQDSQYFSWDSNQILLEYA